MLVVGIRIAFVLLATAIGWINGSVLYKASWQGGLIGLAVSMVFLALELRYSKQYVHRFFEIAIGSVVGFIVYLVVVVALDQIGPTVFPNMGQEPAAAAAMRAALLLTFVFAGVILVQRTKDDFKIIIPYLDFRQQGGNLRGLLMDTSAIIDGRVADVARCHVLDNRLLVPEFVIAELQGIADSSDGSKRARGRRGLDILARMQADPTLDLKVVEIDDRSLHDVDQKLVKFARELPAALLTTDFNLAKAAELRGVKVVNLNEVALALQPAFLPGDKIDVLLIRPGGQGGQAVGHLDDGTMVVVANAQKEIDKRVVVNVASVLQRPQGKIVFADLADSESGRERPSVDDSGVRRHPGRADASSSGR
jgi:uncharacterized protein YacL